MESNSVNPDSACSAYAANGCWQYRAKPHRVVIVWKV